MALGGDLRNINLADIFQTLSMNRQIGTLVVRNGVKEKRVYFSGTGVSLCSGRTIPGFRLGRYLVGTGKVAEEDLRIALEEQRRTGDGGARLQIETLVDAGLVPCAVDEDTPCSVAAGFHRLAAVGHLDDEAFGEGGAAAQGAAAG